MVLLFYTTYISVDVDHEVFNAEVCMGGINMLYGTNLNLSSDVDQGT